MAEAEFRFVVGESGTRSSSWRAMVHRDGSFYVSPREMQGAFKVSLHPPREGELADGWFFGFTKDFADTNDIEPEGHPRLERFHVVPRVLGVTRVCTVRIHSAVVNWERPLRKERLHTWIPTPTEGAATEIVFCLITDPGVNLPLDDSSRVGELANDQAVRMLALYREVRVKERMRLAGEIWPDATDADLAQLRGVAMGRLTEDGSALLEEVAGERR